MNDQQQRLHRIDRLAEVRQSYVTAAEGRVREAEQHVRLCEEAAEHTDRQIRLVREEIAYLDHSSGAEIQNRERYVFTLHVRARQAREMLDKARKVLDSRRHEWREARRDQMVIEKVQERRLQEWQHSVNVADQKDVDEMTVARHARNQFNRRSTQSANAGNSTSGANNSGLG
jgi:flagellar export protein FliJ